MTTGASASQNHPDLFVADFYPQFGEYLAEQHATGYDTGAGRARFLAWLSEHADFAEDHADDGTDDDTDDGSGEDEVIVVFGDDDDLPAAQVLPAAAADPVKDYLKQISKLPRLGAEQEAELARRIEAGRHAQAMLAEDITLSADVRIDLQQIAEDGTRAKNHLLEANLRAGGVAGQAVHRAGHAVPGPDPGGQPGPDPGGGEVRHTKGYKFSTYATWWIRQAITRAMASQARTIRIPVHMVEVINKLARVQRQMLQDLGREPTPDELAIELDMTPEKVIEAQRYRREPGSLPAPGRDGEARPPS